MCQEVTEHFTNDVPLQFESENDPTVQQLLQIRTLIVAEKMRQQDSGAGTANLLYKYLKEQRWPRHFYDNESGEVKLSV